MMLETLFLLLCGHALADFGLQTEWMSFNKGRSWVLFHHCMIHGLMVYLATGHISLAILEVVCHWFIDSFKMVKRISFDADQWSHIVCKIVWSVLA